jgi:DNA replicative helicase MCM subunit Mcm2 (Cdc46/Mcm family)
MTEYPSEAEIQTLIEQIDERPWSVDGYEFAGGSEQTFTVTFAVEWVGEEPTTSDDVETFSTMQSDDRRTVKAIVAELENNHEGAPVSAVLNLAEEIGMDRDTAENELDTLRRQGDVYEPTAHHLRSV